MKRRTRKNFAGGLLAALTAVPAMAGTVPSPPSNGAPMTCAQWTALVEESHGKAIALQVPTEQMISALRTLVRVENFTSSAEAESAISYVKFHVVLLCKTYPSMIYLDAVDAATFMYAMKAPPN